MVARRYALLLFLLLASVASPARADNYSDALKTFRGAGQSSKFFGTSYGYALFPNIGKGGIGLGYAMVQGVSTLAAALSATLR